MERGELVKDAAFWIEHYKNDVDALLLLRKITFSNDQTKLYFDLTHKNLDINRVLISKVLNSLAWEECLDICLDISKKCLNPFYTIN